MTISRREFLTRAGKSGAAVLAAGGTGYWLHARDKKPEPPEILPSFFNYAVPPPQGAPDIVEIRGENYAAITTQAIEEAGGIDAFVRPGDRVVLKPNVSWDRTVEQGANTHPEIVSTVVTLCLKAGAKEVIVTDVSCNDPRRCFNRSGIAKAAQEAGAVVLLPEERRFKRVDMGGKLLRERPVLTSMLEADKVINLPILKQHYLCFLTIGMKNWYGIIGGLRAQLHQDIHGSIVELARFMRPTMIILDATRVMMTNGPSGGSTNDVKKMNTVAAGFDQVAMDTYGARLFGMDPARIPFLRQAEEAGVGTMDLDRLKIVKMPAA